MDEQRDRARTELADLLDAGQVVIDHPRVLLTRLADETTSGAHDQWFEDAKA
jgi:CRISPR-associated protein Cst2